MLYVWHKIEFLKGDENILSVKIQYKGSIN